jgi:hypothetical protein
MKGTLEICQEELTCIFKKRTRLKIFKQDSPEIFQDGLSENYQDGFT